MSVTENTKHIHILYAQYTL